MVKKLPLDPITKIANNVKLQYNIFCNLALPEYMIP